MEPLIGGPASPFRLGNTPAPSAHPMDSQQARELSDFSFYKAVNTGEFLSFSEFPGPLSAKALSSPQRSLLIDIWGHLFRRCFDDSVKITAENVNDEVPRLFKEIGYPFPISKSAMLAPGTGHQWPHHLAALSWLCELLIYENEFFYQEEEAAEMQAARGDLVGRMFAAAYPQLGKDPQALRAAVLGQLHAMNREAEATQQQLQQQLQQRQQQLAAVEAELRDNASLMDSIEQLKKEISTLRCRIADTRAEISHQESLAAATEAERDSLLLQQKTAMEEVQKLAERVKAQGIDKAEVERIRHDVSRLREGLSHRSKVADDSEKLRIAGQSNRKTLEKRMQLVQEDLQQLQQQQQDEQQQLLEAERRHLEGMRMRETKQQYQQQQQQLQHLVQQQQQLLEQEERQQQQQVAAAIEELQQQQQLALQQKEILLQQLRSITETKVAECAALEQQLSELTDLLGHPSSEDSSTH
ncbi:HEC/Ndc80p family protein, putative [Eimeria praecox]|uniref:Kinetochore protein NDC80 n=1 Tax=Eimeria praecox TaxID=51316 RepID=U6H2I6_9EIME|nr:HEC/Ndc80p family protein, putative [Eimeria praecox]